MNVHFPKRILHIVEDLKIGGLEKVLATIVSSLDPSKYDVQVWCLARGGDVAQALIEKGIPVRILDMTSYYNPLAVARLGRLMKREYFHLIHTHGYFASTFGRFAAIWARIPVIITHVHSTYYDYNRRNLLLERFLSHFTDRIICISKAVEKFVIDNEGISKKKTCLIYNAVALDGHPATDDSKKELRLSLGIEEGAIVVTIVASLTANKGHRILLDAFAQVSRTHLSIRLLVVGDGPMRMQLEAFARQLMIDKLTIFTGIRNDIFRLLEISDIFVLPSQVREGLGIALIEAMTANLPVIGTDLGGIPEVILDGENGFLVSPGSAEQLADAIKKLADDTMLRISMGQRGRKIYDEKFTISRMMKQIESLYNL